METTKDLEKYTYDLLAERGVTLDDIAELVFYVQKPYMPNLKLEECRQVWLLYYLNGRCIMRLLRA